MSREEDQAFLKTFTGVIILLVAMTIALIVIATAFFGGGSEEAQQRLARERAEANLDPVGEVRLSGDPMPTVAKASEASGSGGGGGEPRSGEQVVQAVCIACHQGGFMNAPAVGDKEGWAPRAEKGLSTLVDHVQNGFGNMPAQGASASEEEIRKAVLWMLEEETGVEVPQG